MRKLVAALLVLATISATAQQAAQAPVAAPPAGWQKVQALAAGTSIKVKTRTGNTACTLKSVDAGALTCNHGKDIVIQQADILTVKVPHRGRSALVGLAIGGGGGAIVGAASIPSCSGICIISRSTGAVVVGVAGALIGAIVGVTTDFTHTTVYKAP